MIGLLGGGGGRGLGVLGGGGRGEGGGLPDICAGPVFTHSRLENSGYLTFDVEG